MIKPKITITTTTKIHGITLNKTKHGKIIKMDLLKIKIPSIMLV